VCRLRCGRFFGRDRGGGLEAPGIEYLTAVT
jgi:hypothetical protein